MTARFAAIYEGDPLSTWDSNVLLRIVAFWRRGWRSGWTPSAATTRPRRTARWGPEYVDRPDVLFGRSVQPVGDGS
jgi:hypothetical protein